jgi:60 kDa SS-A/Ro ribonucleoprotein
MPNKTTFATRRGALTPAASTFNMAGGAAYRFSPKQALAQYAATGCTNATFYASAERQLASVIALAYENDPRFVAQTAIYCREKGFMKDLPALLCAVLAMADAQILSAIFPRVIDDAKMLKNFVQIVRSGVVGRKSLGTLPKRLVRTWLDARDEESLFRASVGQSPSLSDVVRMVHPKPGSPARSAFYAYLLGRAHDAAMLPALVRDFEAYKATKGDDVPAVPFQMLTALDLSTREWIAIAKNASWQTTRMNLNTFARHGVFGDRGVTRLIAERLRDAGAIAKARALPYQLMMAFSSAGDDVPRSVLEALEDAMEIAIANVPQIDGQVYVCPDVSGSMSSPVTGHRKGSTTKARCIDVAALVAAAMLRKNPTAEVMPFETKVTKVKLNARDTVMTNANRLASIGGGGTNCSAPLAELNRRKAKGDLVIFVSDNESWADPRVGCGTTMMVEWAAFKARSPRAKLVCIDLQPNATTQAASARDVLNVGGFSDSVFEVINAFADTSGDDDGWVSAIERIAL